MALVDQWREELGLDWKEMPSTEVHRRADKEHSDLMWTVLERYGADEQGFRAVIEGARESLVIDRAYRLALSVAMEGME